jgi:DmsE family decaheme c-type cytochrome
VDLSTRWTLVLCAAGALVWSFTTAAPADAAWQDHDATAACTGCHDGGDGHPVLEILHTPHAVMGDPRTPFARDGCAGCHGDSFAHMRRPSEPTDIVFRRDGPTPARAQNRVCLDCHLDSVMHWSGSAHERNDLVCSDCHRMHAARDLVLSKHTEAEACASCHMEQHARRLRPFNHPLLDGRMSCSDCHAPHGSAGPASLAGRNTNETCFACHAELRGPFLWEHAPVREDCSHCHQPHGSVHPGMLVSRAPWLCQQCHMAQFHPSVALSGTGLPGASLPSGSSSLLGQHCLNCHVAVHGSNHPSGAGFTR